jgi:microcin C transport system permease protein
MFSPITKKRWRRFKSVKRGYCALITLTVLYLLSLGAELWVNDQPILVKYDGKIKVPLLFFYSDQDLGGEYYTEAQYKELAATDAFAPNNAAGNWMWYPIIPYGENEAFTDLPDSPPTAPGAGHWLGTDDRGRDLFVRILYGFRVSMSFALLVLLVEVIMGTIVGALQGFFGGMTDLIIQRLTEILVAIPFLVVVMLLGNLFGTSFGVLLMIFGIFGWVTTSRYMRGEFLRARKREYVDASRALGVPAWKIIFRHILPNSLTPLVTLAPFIVASAISSLSVLDFLGFGVPAPTASWGEILSQARSNLTKYHLSVFPFLALFGTLVLINFVGEAVREALDPKPYFRYKG